ncbi:MAG: hypothetical protein RW306_18380 [Geobacteraceae bacterium]|nr:hypothetical protein [Geobacteraceae bacterium]
MKKPILFFLKLILLSLLLLPVFAYFDAAYFYIISFAILKPLEQIDYVSSKSLYPFFILILATPGIGIKRSSLSILTAISLSLLIDLCMIYAWDTFPFSQANNPSNAHIWAGMSWHVFMNWILPILLWFVVAQKQIEQYLKSHLVKNTVNNKDIVSV